MQSRSTFYSDVFLIQLKEASDTGITSNQQIIAINSRIL
jgi:hypothetical protein